MSKPSLTLVSGLRTGNPPCYHLKTRNGQAVAPQGPAIQTHEYMFINACS